MGDRPPLTVDAARSALVDAEGDVHGVRRAPDRPAIGGSVRVSFRTWSGIEAPLLDRLVAGEPAWDVLNVDRALPALGGASWRDVAAAATRPPTTRHDHVLAHFGDGILLALGETLPPRPRPWSTIFDAAELRAPRPDPGGPSAVIGDFLADRVWDMSWADHGSFALARVSLAALALVAESLVERFVGEGARPDRAAAEAIFIVDIASSSQLWGEVATELTPARLESLSMLCDPQGPDA